jgi:hypothetical protein
MPGGRPRGQDAVPGAVEDKETGFEILGSFLSFQVSGFRFQEEKTYWQPTLARPVLVFLELSITIYEIGFTNLSPGWFFDKARSLSPRN